MDILFIVLAAICLLVGIVGCIIPALPGVPLAYAALWLLQATDKIQFSWKFLVIWGIITIIVQVVDYIVPIWGTKKFGGSKWGTRGSTIGLIIGMFLGPLGLILGPFVGAVVFEWLHDKDFIDALKIGFGSFVGFLGGTFLKLVSCAFIFYYFIAALI